MCWNQLWYSKHGIMHIQESLGIKTLIFFGPRVYLERTTPKKPLIFCLESWKVLENGVTVKLFLRTLSHVKIDRLPLLGEYYPCQYDRALSLFYIVVQYSCLLSLPVDNNCCLCFTSSFKSSSAKSVHCCTEKGTAAADEG